MNVILASVVRTKKCKGTYMLNPQYFFKGKLVDKSKLELRMVTNPD